jgi:hypothetical protein
MIHSHLTYCMNIYSCANTTNLQRLRVKQKEATRVINNAGYRDHTARLFKLNNILPLDELITFSKLKFMHNYVHHKLPLCIITSTINFLFHLMRCGRTM